MELGTGVQGAPERSSSDIQCVLPAPDTPPNAGGAGVGGGVSGAGVGGAGFGPEQGLEELVLKLSSVELWAVSFLVLEQL